MKKKISNRKCVPSNWPGQCSTYRNACMPTTSPGVCADVHLLLQPGCLLPGVPAGALPPFPHAGSCASPAKETFLWRAPWPQHPTAGEEGSAASAPAKWRANRRRLAGHEPSPSFCARPKLAVAGEDMRAGATARRPGSPIGSVGAFAAAANGAPHHHVHLLRRLGRALRHRGLGPRGRRAAAAPAAALPPRRRRLSRSGSGRPGHPCQSCGAGSAAGGERRQRGGCRSTSISPEEPETTTPPLRVLTDPGVLYHSVGPYPTRIFLTE